MKRITTAALAGVSLLALTAPAYALESIAISIGYALFASPLGAVFSFSSLVSFSQLAVVGGISAASLLSGGQDRPAHDPGQFKSIFENAETSEVNAGGRVRLGGLKAFGNTKNKVVSRVIWHCAGPAVAIEEHYLGGREVVVDSGTGYVSSPPWTSTVFGSFARIKSQLGTGAETAPAELIADFPSLITTNHRGRGVFQSLNRFQSPGFNNETNINKHQQLYGSGVPDHEITARVGRIYDPRLDSTNGGSGAHRVDTPSTWEWTMNGPLWAVHILRRSPQFTSSPFDWEFIAEEADRADALVDTLTGTEPRSTFSGVWLSEVAKGDTMEDVLRSIGCEIVTRSNKIAVRLIDDERTPDVEFDIIDVIKVGVKYGPDGLRRKNICRVWYYSPERNYDMTEVDLSGAEWAKVDSEIDKYGPKYFDVRLPYCSSASQAQRIAHRLFKMERARGGQMDMIYSGMAAWGAQVVSFPMPDLDETAVAQIESPKEDPETGRVNIPFKIIPEIIWDAETMEQPAPEPIPSLAYEAVLNTPKEPAEAVVVQYPGGTFETRLLFAAVDEEDDPIVGAAISEANYRTYTGSNPDSWQSMTEYQSQVSAGTWYGWISDGDMSGDKTDFRVRFYTAAEEGSYPSDLLEVASLAIDNTTPTAPSVTVDVTGAATTPDVDFSATTADLRVVRMLFETNDGSWVTVANKTTVRPGVTEDASTSFGAQIANRTVLWRVSTFTSNGTQSAYTSGSFLIPGTG